MGIKQKGTTPSGSPPLFGLILAPPVGITLLAALPLRRYIGS